MRYSRIVLGSYGLQQVGELFDRDLQILNDASQGFSLDVALMHRNHDTSLVARSHINRMASGLMPKHKA
jgi:hypothetical protein